jgi:hypothetical protein
MRSISARLLVGLLAVLAAVCGAAPDTGAVKALRDKYPRGIPWQIALFDGHGKSLGKLDVVITAEPGRSCLGGFDEGSVREGACRPWDLRGVRAWEPIVR